MDLNAVGDLSFADFVALPQADRDACFNNGAAVPGWETRMARWAEQSRALREEARATEQAYGTAARQTLDLLPGREAHAPCLVFVHGGYWRRNSKAMFTAMAAGVRAHGWAAALPGYTLAPEAALSDIVAEIRAALDWLGRQGPAHGVAGPIILAGWSAGAHLTALALDHPAVARGFAISGVFELAPIALTYIHDDVRFTPEEIDTLSPRRRPVVPKRLDMAYGTRELAALRRCSERFHGLRAAAGAPGDLLACDHDHFSILEELVAPDGLLTRHLVGLGRG